MLVYFDPHGRTDSLSKFQILDILIRTQLSIYIQNGIVCNLYESRCFGVIQSFLLVGINVIGMANLSRVDVKDGKVINLGALEII